MQSLFRDTNPNSIASKLNKGLNRVAEKLVVKKKIHNCKDMRDFDDRELWTARAQIKEQSKIAHYDNDNDEMRLLKHMKNLYAKLEKALRKSMKRKLTSIGR